MTGIVITEMVVPPAADAPDAGEFRAMVDISNRVAEADTGIDDLNDTPEQLLPSWQEQTDRIRRGFIARFDGEIVGAGSITTERAQDDAPAEIEIAVLPAQWPSGAAQALLERLEDEVRLLGRKVVQAWTLHPAARSERMLTPATGFGAVSATRLSDLLTTNGYGFEQVERNSVLPLDAPTTTAEQHLREATAFAGPDYRVITWTLPTPSALRAGYGSLIARMATDVPSGELEMPAEVWDDERVARREAQFSAGRQTMSVAAVMHEPSGELVAFNELVIGADRTGVTHQWGTLVVSEHRGRRLGTIVKCANLIRWRDLAPDSVKISTFNAEENRPMLDINEAIGFVPASFAGAWQKRLD